jgi:hypothetical protein
MARRRLKYEIGQFVVNRDIWKGHRTGIVRRLNEGLFGTVYWVEFKDGSWDQLLWCELKAAVRRRL